MIAEVNAHIGYKVAFFSETKIIFIIYILKAAIRQFLNERFRVVVTDVLVLVRYEVKFLLESVVKLMEVLRFCFQRCKPLILISLVIPH